MLFHLFSAIGQEKLKIDIQKSTIKWIGEYTFYFGEHEGYNLVDHLKKENFFDVKKYPLGTLKITKVEYHDKISARLEANLTLKGITKSINFQAKFDYKEKEMKTRFKIDRKKWKVNYESKFKDGAISDAIGFEVSIKL